MKFADRMWLWGQNPGSHHLIPTFKLSGHNRMDAITGCRHFNIPNCLRVVMPSGPEPPFDRETEKLSSLRQVVWSVVGSHGVSRNDDNNSDLEEVLRQAEKFPNVTGAVLDDFFRSPQDAAGGASPARHTLENLEKICSVLHNFPGRRLDLWLVWYDFQLVMDVTAYLKLCDIITFWTWQARELAMLENNFQKFLRLTPGKRRFCGIYLWDYGDGKPINSEMLRHQCEFCYHRMRDGELEGMIICSNCVADIGLESVKIVEDFLQHHSGEDF